MNDPDLEPATDNFPIETRMPGAPGSGVFDHNGLDAARALETEAESRIASEVVVPEVAMLSDAPAPDPDVDLLETSPTAPTAPTAQNGVDQHLPPVSDDGDMDLT